MLFRLCIVCFYRGWQALTNFGVTWRQMVAAGPGFGGTEQLRSTVATVFWCCLSNPCCESTDVVFLVPFCRKVSFNRYQQRCVRNCWYLHNFPRRHDRSRAHPCRCGSEKAACQRIQRYATAISPAFICRLDFWRLCYVQPCQSFHAIRNYCERGCLQRYLHLLSPTCLFCVLCNVVFLDWKPHGYSNPSGSIRVSQRSTTPTSTTRTRTCLHLMPGITTGPLSRFIWTTTLVGTTQLLRMEATAEAGKVQISSPMEQSSTT